MKPADMLARMEADGNALAAAATALLEATAPGKIGDGNPRFEHCRGDLAEARDNWNRRRHLDGVGLWRANDV